MATPLLPAWALANLDTFFDLANWRVSAKGNPYIRIGRYCCTTFPRPGGFAWCIAAGGKDKPLWSPETLGSERCGPHRRMGRAGRGGQGRRAMTEVRSARYSAQLCRLSPPFPVSLPEGDDKGDG